MVAITAASSTKPYNPYVEQATQLARQHAAPLEDQMHLFLETVWLAQPSDALLGLSVESEYWGRREAAWQQTVSTKWLWKNTLESSFKNTYEWAQGQNNARYTLPGSGSAYWQTASRKSSVLGPGRFNARGALDELVAVTSLYCDLDVAKHNYNLTHAFEALLSLPLVPTFIVFTGGGLQAIHVLSDPWIVLNREAAQEYKAYSLAFYADLYQRTGLELDPSVHEASRMLRLPGTANRKPSRAGALAHLVWYDPQALYTADQIKSLVTLPEPAPRRINVLAPRGSAPEGTYQVGQEFIHYLIDRAPAPPERHPVLLKLTMQAARSGIPEDAYLAHLRPVALDWYSEAPHRAEKELDSLVAWSYQRGAEDSEAAPPTGNYLIRLDESGFALADEEAHDALRDRTEAIDPSELSGDSELLATPAPIQQLPSLSEVRTEQATKLREYATSRLPKGLGTYMLVRTPPGSGKSHAAIQTAYEFALTRGTDQGGRGKVALLTQFQLDEYGWRDWLTGFDLDGAAINRAMYIVGRNADTNSAGYCAMNTLADAVAAKGHNAVMHVCKRCPVATQCEQDWYLSQFKKAQKKEVVIARHQHGVVDLLLEYRRFIVFDESPLGVVARATILGIKDLVFSPPGVMRDQYRDPLVLLEALLTALRKILSDNLPAAEPNSTQHIRLGGYWLIDKLAAEMGLEALMALCDLPEEPVNKAGEPPHFRLTLEDVAALPYNYLWDLWDILRYEFQTHYLAGAQRWNSRLIAWGPTLRLYPMRAFSFDPQTKIVVTDATGQPDLYNKAFLDTDSQKPRQAFVYETALQPHARITQWVNSGNSRRAFQRRKLAPKLDFAALKIRTVDGEAITLEAPEEAETAALVRAKAQITLLAARHHGSLLVVSYLKIHPELKKWCSKSGILNPDYFQYYGNLRGKNDFEVLEAVLLIGEPRIPPMEVFVAAQIWHWDEALPIDFDLDRRGHRLEPYLGYVDPVDGKGRAYAYPGYLDERLNRIYVWSIQAEMRQCYERIRANAPEVDAATGELQEKFVYIAAQMPCSDHVDELAHWSQWEIDLPGRAWYLEQIKAGQPVTQAEYIASIKADKSWSTYQASFQRVHNALKREGLVEDAGIEKTKLTLAIDWLTDQRYPERRKLSTRMAHKENPLIGLPTWARALKAMGGG